MRIVGGDRSTSQLILGPNPRCRGLFQVSSGLSINESVYHSPRNCRLIFIRSSKSLVWSGCGRKLEIAGLCPARPQGKQTVYGNQVTSCLLLWKRGRITMNRAKCFAKLQERGKPARFTPSPPSPSFSPASRTPSRRVITSSLLRNSIKMENFYIFHYYFIFAQPFSPSFSHHSLIAGRRARASWGFVTFYSAVVAPFVYSVHGWTLSQF